MHRVDTERAGQGRKQGRAARWRSSLGGIALAAIGAVALLGGALDAGSLRPDSAEAFEYRPRQQPQVAPPELAAAPARADAALAWPA